MTRTMAKAAFSLETITVPEIFDDRGRVNGVSLASVLDVSPAEVAKSVDLTPRGLRANPVSPRIQRAGRAIGAMLARLQHALGSRRDALIWLKTPRRQLSGSSPLEAMLHGDIASVETLVYAIETGQPM